MFILLKHVCYTSKGRDLSTPLHILFSIMVSYLKIPASAYILVVILLSGTSFIEI